jgi:hypothetical protein
MKLMERCVAAFHKIFDNPEEVLEIHPDQVKSTAASGRGRRAVGSEQD